MPPILYKILLYLFGFIGFVASLGTFLSLLESEYWLVRAWDFPRYQLCVLALVSLVMLWSLTLAQLQVTWRLGIVTAVLAVVISFQLYRIFPYTPLASHMSMPTTNATQENTINVLVANVLMKNKDRDTLFKLVQQQKPDVALFLETDQAWIDHLDGLTKDLPHRVAVPQDDTYGMVLYSKFPLHDTKVRYLMQENVPSIRTEIELPSSRRVLFYALHPKPPSPQESKTSLPRDAELVYVAHEIESQVKLPALVAGDMNDVAWSDTTLLFLKISDMLDPRVGRGLYNTFHVQIPPLRVPLDHVFHTPDFTLQKIQRLPNVHSDHYPMFISLHLEPMATEERQDKTLPSKKEDVEKAQQKLNEASSSQNSDEYHTPDKLNPPDKTE